MEENEDDIFNDEDDKIFQELKQKRILELQKQYKNEKYGYIKHIERPDFIREVTEGSEKEHVVVFLHQD